MDANSASVSTIRAPEVLYGYDQLAQKLVDAGFPIDRVLHVITFLDTIALGSALDDRGVPSAERDQVVSAVVDSSGSAIAGLAADPSTAAVADAAKQAFSDATRLAAFTAAGFLVVGLIATIPLGRVPRPAGGDAGESSHASPDAKRDHNAP